MFVASAARAAIYNFTPSAGVVTASYANHFVTLSISGQNSTNVPSESTQDISIHNGVVGWSSVSPPRVYSYVFDAARGKWIGTSSSDGPTYDLSSRDGVVAWSKSDLARAAFFRVYDPATGNWVSGSGTGPVVEPQVLNANGVVAWSTSTKANFRVYDPTRGGWRSGEANLSTRTSDLTTEGGVVAWSVNSTPTRVDYIVYDPLRGEWRGGAEVGAGFTTGLTVQDSQVTWTTSGGDFFRGYHGPNGAWIDGLPVALAYFAVSTDLGNAPFYVSFIDMSIGGTAWSWNFGDGTGPSFQRSTTYRYTTYGRFTATQTVNGSSTNRIIVTDTLPPAGTNVINGGATFTTNPVVTLTLLASDNSGVVANMRFSNTNGTWPGWESFAATKLWTLSPSNGTKTVFAQFLDSAGNTSATASASIQLDTTPPPTVSFVTTNVNESAGTVSLRAVLDHPYSQPVIVGYATANGTAAAPGDYVSTSGTLTFASNLTSASFSLTIQPDSVVELNETVLINFTAISNVVAGPPGTLTILDDDLASVSFAADNSALSKTAARLRSS